MEAQKESGVTSLNCSGRNRYFTDNLRENIKAFYASELVDLSFQYKNLTVGDSTSRWSVEVGSYSKSGNTIRNSSIRAYWTN